MPNSPRKSPETENDLREIWKYLADSSAKAADAMLGRIERTFNMLTSDIYGSLKEQILGLLYEEALKGFDAGAAAAAKITSMVGAARQ